MRAKRKKRINAEQRRIADQVRDLYIQHKPLNISAVRESNHDLLLAAYTVKPFLGWKQAIEAAGIKYSKIKCSVPETIECRICGARRKKLDQHLVHHHDMSSKDYLQLYRGSSLSAPLVKSLALKPAGLFLPHWEPHWSPEYVLDRLYALHKLDAPLYSSNIEQLESLTYRWALTFFKDWDVVLTALQMDPQTVRKAASKKLWTKASLCKEVRRLKLLRYDVNWTSMLKHDRSITAAAIQLYGSYDSMLQASGLNPARIRRAPKPKNLYRTESDIINAICRRRLKDHPINTNGVCKGKFRDLSLYNRALRVFGSWGKAVKAAGLDYDKISHHRNSYSSKKKAIAGLQERHKNGDALTAQQVRYGQNKDGQLYTAVLKYFKSWQAGVEKAGISLEEIYPSKAKYVSRDDVIAQIEQRKRRGLGLSSFALSRGQGSDLALYMRARRLFKGGWNEALECAGIQNDEVLIEKRKYADKKAVTSEIKRRRKAGLPLNAMALSSGPQSDPALYGSGRKEYGSWQKAVESAAIEFGTVTTGSKYPSKTAIINAIQQRHAKKLPLNFKAIAKGQDADSALYARCVREFGGWKQAVEGAGISYSTVSLPKSKYPTLRAVTNEIKSRKELGRSVKYNEVERGKDSDRPLMLAACKFFGSWRESVEASS